MTSANEIVKKLRIETLVKITVKLFQGLIWLGVIIGSLVLLALLALTVINAIQGRALRQTLSQLKAEKYPLTISEIKPAPVPDDQNAAVLFRQLPRFIARNTNDWLEVEAIGKLVYANSNRLDITTWPAENREQVLTQINKPDIEKYLNIVAEASKKPFLNCNIKYEDGPSAFIPNMSALRNLVRISCIKAVLDIQAGNNEAAYEKIIAGYKIANLLTQEPNLIFQLVSISIDNILKDCLEIPGNTINIPADKAAAIIKELDRHTGSQPWLRALDMERVAFGLWVLSHKRDIGGILQMPKWIRFWPFFNKDISIYLKLSTDIQKNFTMPYYDFIKSGRQNLCDRELVNHWKGFVIFSTLAVPGFDGIYRNKVRHEANVVLVQAALALKLFKQKNGAYPNALDKIAPEFIEKNPVDPFNGQSLIYRKEGEGFILYSVGPNLSDDNGTPLPYKGFDAMPHDIVWKSRK